MSQRKARILCVDDDGDALALRGQLLANQGYEAILCRCPLESLQMAFAEIDLAIVDFEMPAMDGRELFLRMRRAGALCPIILYSAFEIPNETKVLFTACLAKGTPIPWLLSTIRMFLAYEAGCAP
jgi:CheY-like chemotaxis protein